MTPLAPALRNFLCYCRSAVGAPTGGSCFGKMLSTLRYYPRWRSSLAERATPLRDGSPWMTFAAIDFVGRWLEARHAVYEYGCGGSTLFFSSRARSVISVEHDPLWAAAVSQAMQDAGLTNWTCHLLEPETCRDGASPEYRSSSPLLRGRCFEAYAGSIDSYANGSFDLVLIDGRARVGCALHAARKVARWGCLILDNSERPAYAPVHRQMAAFGWEKRRHFGPGPYNGYFWETTIWTRTR
jgi:hypothetical protein